jgi:SAM-dependent MidA family methyltransferase
LNRLRAACPLTVAEFMDLSLYDPECGYYARAARRSGREGDFFTSVDVGPLFGELLAIQLAEMATILAHPGCERDTRVGVRSRRFFDLVEAGAGDGRLAADILLAARERDLALYESIRLHLIEASPRARAAHRATLGDMVDRLQSSSPSLPDSFEGVLIANELLDALPVHQVVMREEGLRELYVAGSESSPLRLIEAPPSTPRLQEYLDRLGIALEPGWRAEINLRAVDWVAEAARRMKRGFMILTDYGHVARELYSVTHASGTLTTFSRHRSAGPEWTSERRTRPLWLESPGNQDMTAHVDFTSVQAAAEAEGMITLGFLDQTYFLMGLLFGANRQGPNPQSPSPQSAIRNPGAPSPGPPAQHLRWGESPGPPAQHLRWGESSEPPAQHLRWGGSAAAARGRNSQLKTLILPGGLGSTLKVLVMGKNVGTPKLGGCSFSVRVT